MERKQKKGFSPRFLDPAGGFLGQLGLVEQPVRLDGAPEAIGAALRLLWLDLSECASVKRRPSAASLSMFGVFSLVAP